jgi:phage shock protein A
MFRLLRRTYKYTVALLGRRFEDVADPEIQIEQAIEEGKRQHALLVQQAAAVIGNQHQLELRLRRTIDQVEALRSSAREALRLADAARESGDGDATTSYEETAQSFAVALVSTEAEMRDLKVLHDHAVDGAAAAKEAVETNALELRQRLTERTRLLSQLEQTKLQERMNAALGSMSALAPASEVPSFDRIRDKIELRYTQALGLAEVSSTTVEVRTLNVQKASLDAEAARQLSALRASLTGASSLNGEERP